MPCHRFLPSEATDLVGLFLLLVRGVEKRHGHAVSRRPGVLHRDREPPPCVGVRGVLVGFWMTEIGLKRVHILFKDNDNRLGVGCRDRTTGYTFCP